MHLLLPPPCTWSLPWHFTEPFSDSHSFQGTPGVHWLTGSFDT
jgi:hypothetical protein